MRRSVELARRAAADEPGARSSRWVAASVGPYGAMLGDGSEYRGDYGLSVAELRAFHRERLAVLADAGADVLAVETIPSLAEVEAVVAELDALGVPAWISITAAGAADPGRGAGRRSVRAGRGRADRRRGRRQLHPPRRRRGPARAGRRGHRQAADRLPEQRRGLGRERAAQWRGRPGIRATADVEAGSASAPASSAAAAASRPSRSRPSPRDPSLTAGSGDDLPGRLALHASRRRARRRRPRRSIRP